MFLHLVRAALCPVGVPYTSLAVSLQECTQNATDESFRKENPKNLFLKAVVLSFKVKYDKWE